MDADEPDWNRTLREQCFTTIAWRLGRELLHHLSEVCLPRDLYLHTNGATR